MRYNFYSIRAEMTFWSSHPKLSLRLHIRKCFVSVSLLCTDPLSFLSHTQAGLCTSTCGFHSSYSDHLIDFSREVLGQEDGAGKVVF